MLWAPLAPSHRHRRIIRHLRHAGPPTVQSREIHGLLAHHDADTKAYRSSCGHRGSATARWLRICGFPEHQRNSKTDTRTPSHTTATKYRYNPYFPQPTYRGNTELASQQQRSARIAPGRPQVFNRTNARHRPRTWTCSSSGMCSRGPAGVVTSPNGICAISFQSAGIPKASRTASSISGL